MKKLGVIPVRSGSKGVVGKNTRLLAGRPLLHYMLEEALQCDELDCVVVTSDCRGILSLAGQLDDPHDRLYLLERPEELSRDETPSVPVVQHALHHIEAERGDRFDVITLMHATAPLTLRTDIDACIRKLVETGCDSVTSMVEVTEMHPMKMKRIENDQIFPMVDGMEEFTFRRQEIPTTYKRNCAIFTTRRENLIDNNFPVGFFSGPVTRPYVMPGDRSLDINNELDFQLAELLMERRHPLPS